MREICTSGLMSGEWKQSFDIVDATAPLLDSTLGLDSLRKWLMISKST